VVAFFLTPFVLHSLGEVRYGVWTLAIGFTGYYGLLDLGFSAGLTQYLTRYLATKDFDRLNRTASSGMVALTCCGAVVLIGSLAIAFNAAAFFQIPEAATMELALVISIMGASVAIQFGFFVYSAVFTAVQRFDLSNGIGIATRILSAGGTVICLKAGYGLIGLSMVLAGTNLIDYLLRWHIAKRLIPNMKISLSLVSRESLAEVMKFGIWNFVTAGSARLISYTDSLVIAAFMPVAAVAPFAIAANLRSYFEEIFVRAGFVFFPAVTELDAQGNREGLANLYLVSSKFMFLGSILCGSMAILWAGDFFRLWLGPAYAKPADYPSVASIFYLLILGSMVSVAQRIGYQVLLGIREVALLAVLFAAEGIVNLVMSIFLVRSYGLIGVAVGTLVPAVIFQGVLQPYFVCRSLGITLNTYCREVLLRPTLVLLPVLSVLFAFLSLQSPHDWMTLVLLSSITFAVVILFVLFIGLKKSERAALIVRPTVEALRYLEAMGLTRS
jgi:O-antigen/teichoic acid export membrane protein